MLIKTYTEFGANSDHVLKNCYITNMDSSCSSQKKIRRVLRSSQVYQKPAIKRLTNNVKSDVAWNKLKPKKSSSLIAHDNFIKGVGVEPKRPSSRVEHDKFTQIEGEPKKSTRVEHDKLNDGGGYEKSKIGKVMSKMNKPTGTKKVFTHQSENLDSDEIKELENSFNSNENHMDDDLPALSHHTERESQIQDQDEELKDQEEYEDDDEDEDEEELEKEQGNEQEKDQEKDQEKEQEEDQQFEVEEEDVENDLGNQNFQSNAADTDTESLSGNCLLGMLKGFNKDIGALYTKTNSIEDDIKEIKRVLKTRPSQHCTFRSLSSQFKQSSAYSLLPKFPLLKKSHVRKMESNAEENEEYQLQMVSI